MRRPYNPLLSPLTLAAATLLAACGLPGVARAGCGDHVQTAAMPGKALPGHAGQPRTRNGVPASPCKGPNCSTRPDMPQAPADSVRPPQEEAALLDPLLPHHEPSIRSRSAAWLRPITGATSSIFHPPRRAR